MTIADAFNEITIAQGGTPNYSGTIAAAIDSLNDTLAGSDQPAETTIEGAVRLLGQHIGGGGGYGYDIVITANMFTFTSSTVFTLVEGTSTDVYNKLADGDYARALLICDGSTRTFPAVLTLDSYIVEQGSQEGSIIASFYNHFNDTGSVSLCVMSDGTVFFY